MSTIVQTKTKEAKNKKEQNLKEAMRGNDLDTVLDNVKQIDNACSFTKCKKKTTDFAISCKFCGGRFCTTHGLPEIHGCGEAVRRDEREKFLHPHSKLNQDKHQQASDKLAAKLKQMQVQRKSKQGSTKSKK